MKNPGDSVSKPARRPDADDLIRRFVEGGDFSPCTRRAFKADLDKFQSWFVEANKERLDIKRVTVRDVSDFKSWLSGSKKQAVSTVNRALVSLRSWFKWMVAEGLTKTNPAVEVKELRRQALAPKGRTCLPSLKPGPSGVR